MISLIKPLIRRLYVPFHSKSKITYVLFSAMCPPFQAWETGKAAPAAVIGHDAVDTIKVALLSKEVDMTFRQVVISKFIGNQINRGKWGTSC